jgi:hypothetical protein
VVRPGGFALPARVLLVSVLGGDGFALLGGCGRLALGGVLAAVGFGGLGAFCLLGVFGLLVPGWWRLPVAAGLVLLADQRHHGANVDGLVDLHLDLG